MIVVPGSEHMLNAVNFVGSQPKKIAPVTRITIAMSVLNTHKDSTGDTRITLQRRDSFVGETITRRAIITIPAFHEYLA
jgi:hypothetical protein